MTLVFGTNLKVENQAFADVAARWAQRMGETLRLVHVSEDPRAPIVLGTDEEHLLGEVRAELQREVERIHRQSGAVVRPHLAAGPVTDALVSVAEFELASLLIIGSRSQPSTHLLGGTAERVARKSLVPVLALRDVARLAAWLDGKRTLRVLIGADLGHAATAARDFGARLAQLGSCAFEIIYVVSPGDVRARLGVASSIHEHKLAPDVEAALLRDLARTAPALEKDAKLRVILARGSPDAFLTTLAEQENFDLILLGQRHQSLLAQFWAGSVSRGVLRSAPVSVLSVPAPPQSMPPVVQPYRNIVVAIEFTRVSDQALSHALGLISAGGALHLAYVIPSIDSSLDARDAQQQAWSALSKLAVPEAPAACTTQRHVLEGDAAEQLLILAERLGADLIVLGIEQRHPVSRTLLGSVARGVAENARMPVLLVPYGIP